MGGFAHEKEHEKEEGSWTVEPQKKTGRIVDLSSGVPQKLQEKVTDLIRRAIPKNASDIENIKNEIVTLERNLSFDKVPSGVYPYYEYANTLRRLSDSYSGKLKLARSGKVSANGFPKEEEAERQDLWRLLGSQEAGIKKLLKIPDTK